MLILEDLLYTEDHLWLRIENKNEAIIGLSDYIQERLGNITSVDAPAEGDELSREDEIIFVETLDKEMEFYSPVTGTVLETNTAILDNPALINEDPYDDGWIIRMKLAQPGELDDLLSPDDYTIFVEEHRLKDKEEEEDDMDFMEDLEE